MVKLMKFSFFYCFHYQRIILAYLIILLPFWSLGCSDSAELEKKQSSTEEISASAKIDPTQSAPLALTGEPLKVLQFLPSGKTNKLSHIVAMFNQPMVALGDYAEVPNDILVLDPPIAGQLRWLNQYSLAFFPEKVIDGSLFLTATLKPGLKSLSGDFLANPLHTEIILPQVSVQYAILNEAETRQTPLRPTVEVNFNQPLEFSSFKDKAFFVCDVSSPLPFKIAAQVAELKEGQPNMAFMFTAASDLPYNTTYTLAIEKGLISKAGPVAADKIDNVFSSQTYGPLTVNLRSNYEPITQKDQALDSAKYMDVDLRYQGFLAINFNNPVPLYEAIEYIETEPPLPELIKLKETYRELKKNIQSQNISSATSGTSSQELDLLPLENYSEVIYLYPLITGDTIYRIFFKAGLKDIYGQALGQDLTLSFKTGLYKPQALLASPSGLFESNSQPIIKVKSVGQPKFQLFGYALTKEQAIELISKSNLNITNEFIRKPSELISFLKNLKPSILELSPKPGAIERPTTFNVNLNEVFNNITTNTFYITTLNYNNFNKDDISDYFRFYQISDLGLTVKMGNEQGLAWTTQLSSGKSQSDSLIEIYSVSGRLLYSGQTDVNGLIILPGLTQLKERLKSMGGDPKAEIGNESLSLFIAATYQNQTTLWNLAWEVGFRPWNSGLNPSQYESPFSADEYKSFLLSSQSIYRPGDEAKFKVILRQQKGDDLIEPSQGRVKIFIADSEGNHVFETTAELTQFGTFSFDYSIPKTALGNYFVLVSLDHNIDIVNDKTMFDLLKDKLLLVGIFNCQNFRLPSFEVSFLDPPSEIFEGDNIQLKAKAFYHFGLPVSDQPYEYSATSQIDFDFQIPSLPNFNVINQITETSLDIDEEITGDSIDTLISGNGTVNKEGLIDFKLAAERSQIPRTKKITLYLTVSDVDGRKVYKGATTLLHPASIYPALKNRQGIGLSGLAQLFDLAAVDINGKLTKSDVKLTFYRRNWNTVRQLSPGGYYQYVSKSFDEKVNEQTLTTSGKSPIEFKFTPPKAGFYWVKAELKDEKGRANVSSFFFYVAGQQEIGWSHSGESTLVLVPDKAKYAQGDKVRVLVQSPINQGQALISLETSGVKKAWINDIDSFAPIIEFKLDAKDAPNIFLSVLISQGRIAQKPNEQNLDFGKPKIWSGYVNIEVTKKQKDLLVEVSPSAESFQPGQKVNVDLKVQKPDGTPFNQAEVALVVVDAALIQIGGDQPYYPDRFFSSPRLMAVKTVNPIESLVNRSILAEKGQEYVGGGAEGAAVGFSETRQNFENVACFIPSIALSADGQAKVDFTLPDNLTTFKIFAVATGSGKISATGEASILVTKDLLLRSSLPSYVSKGDKFSAAAVVTNRSDSSKTAQISFEPDKLSLIEEKNSKQIILAPGESQEVYFPVTVTSEDLIKPIFEVKADKSMDRAEFKLPVISLIKPVTQASYRSIEEGETLVDFNLPLDFDPKKGGLTLELSPTLFQVLSGPFDYLTNYPYGCFEQITSKAFGSLISLQLKNRLNLTQEQIKNKTDNINSTIQLISSSLVNGGLNAWPGQNYYNRRSIMITTYALEFLLKAKEFGYNISPSTIKNMTSYLTSSLNDITLNYSGTKNLSLENFESACYYALSVISMSGQLVPSYVEVAYNKRNNLKLTDLFHLLRTIYYQPKSKTRTEQLQNIIKLTLNNITFSNFKAQINTSNLQSILWEDIDFVNALALLSLSEIAPNLEFLPMFALQLVEKGAKNQFSNTHSNAYAILALYTYLNTVEPTVPKIDFKVNLGLSEILNGSFTSFMDLPAKASVNWSTLTDLIEEQISFIASGQGKIWAAIKLTSAPKEVDLKPDTSGGIILSRSYSVVKPQPSKPGLTSFKRGQVVKVTVTLMTPEDRNDIVLQDSIPAGFEPINFNLRTEDQSLIPILNNNEDSQSSDWDYRSNYWYNHQEIWPEKVCVFAQFLPAGVYTFSYLIRPVTVGQYVIPGPFAEEMYTPETFGRGQGHTISVTLD
jgi:uncharacterized protein YfaS (alpha-2-macroglobulin family)